jgi:hypothetical protein
MITEVFKRGNGAELIEAEANNLKEVASVMLAESDEINKALETRLAEIAKLNKRLKFGEEGKMMLAAFDKHPEVYEKADKIMEDGFERYTKRLDEA